MPNINLILGGARSGKSRLAEQRAMATDLQRVYLATATAGDSEMSERIQKHRDDRKNQGWKTIEEPLYLATVLEEELINGDDSNKVILIDCLTLWLSNCLHANVWQEQKLALLLFLKNLSQSGRIENKTNSDTYIDTGNKSQIIFVSNETGLGVVPMGELTRQFVDESGFLHQEIAAIADQVTFVVAGLPTEFKINN